MSDYRRLVGRWLAWLMAGSLGAVSAQTPAPLPNPDVQVYVRGTVLTFARQADGGILLGGEFDAINGVPRSGLARLKPDGSVDPDFTTGLAWGRIYSIAIDSAGAIYAGGQFTRVAGVDRSNLAKLAANGAVDSNWNPAPSSHVYKVAVDGADAVFIRGSFESVGGQTRPGLAKLSGSGGGQSDATWNPGTSVVAHDFVLDGQGAIYVAGNFNAISGQPIRHLARLSSVGAATLDTSWNPSPDLPVFALALDNIGSLYVGGQFTSIGGQNVSTLAKLAATGSGAADPAWRPEPGEIPTRILPDGKGRLYISGSEFSFSGQPRMGIARISASGTGTLDTSFQAQLGGPAYGLLLQPDGTLLVGGAFDTANGKVTLGAVGYSSTGLVLERAINAGVARGYPYRFVKQRNGGMIVAGDFAMVDDQLRRGLFRLHPDGTLDINWNPSPDQPVSSLAIDDDSVYVGGSFSQIGGSARAHIAKVSGSGTGSADAAWNPGTDGMVSALFVDANNVYVGGDFTTVGAQPRLRLAKLSTMTAALDPSWQPTADAGVWRMSGDRQGTVFISGPFQNISGQVRRHAAKIATSGAGMVDPDWNPAPDAFPQLVLDGHGSVYLAGSFNNVGGQPRRGLAKLSTEASGAMDLQWNPVVEPGTQIYAVQPIGRDVYVSGSFEYLGGVVLHNLARLSARTGTVDPVWNPSPAPYMELAAGDAGRIYVGGGLSSIGGMARNGIAALPGADIITVEDFDVAP